VLGCASVVPTLPSVAAWGSCLLARAAEMAVPTSMVTALSWLPGHRRPMQRDGRPEEDAYIDTNLSDGGGGDHLVDARDLH
jgi:hypothetical protein